MVGNDRKLSVSMDSEGNAEIAIGGAHVRFTKEMLDIFSRMTEGGAISLIIESELIEHRIVNSIPVDGRLFTASDIRFAEKKFGILKVAPATAHRIEIPKPSKTGRGRKKGQ